MSLINLGRIAFVNKGIYSVDALYKKNDIVKNNGSVYACLQQNTGVSLTNAAYWIKWLDVSEVAQYLTHNTIQSLQGGKTGEYFHLTSAELTKLQEGYTKAQIDSIITNLNTIETTSQPILGLIWNKTDDTYIRYGKNINSHPIDGFNEFSGWRSASAERQNDGDTAVPSAFTKWLNESANLPFSSMKRYIVDNTGAEIKEYNADSFTHADQTSLLVSQQISVKIPQFYYIQAKIVDGGKTYHFYAISKAVFEIDVKTDLGFTNPTVTLWNPTANVSSGTLSVSKITSALHPAFIDNANNVLTKRYYGAFNAVNGRSICGSGVRATASITRATARAQAQGFGGGFTLVDFFLESAKNLLVIIERGTFYMERGGVYLANKWEGYSWNTGASALDQDNGLTLSLLNKTGVILNASNQTIANSYRGIENYHSALWRFIDGVNSNNYTIYLAKPKATFTDDSTAAPYFNSGYTVPSGASASYFADFGAGSFIPSELGGSATTKTTDAMWSATGNTTLFVGGALSNASTGGLLAWVSSNASSDAAWILVGRSGL